MQRIAFVMLGLAVAGAAAAQTPVPPASPARPSAAVTAPTPRVAPFDDEMRRARERALEDRRWNMEVDRTAAERAFADARVAFDAARETAALAAVAPMPTLPPMPALAPMAGSFGGDVFERRTPPAPWAQGDPADSLYRAARAVLNAGDWGRAARMFADLQKNYPKSAYLNESQYWEAWARYKIGTTDELRTAAKILEPLASRITPAPSASEPGRRMYYVDSRRTSDNEILALYARINGALAQRGDREAAAKVEKAAQQQGAPCDREEIQVRTEALNALSQMDPSQALPILRRVIDRKDACSAELRRNAVFILGRRGDADAQNVLMGVAKSDPNPTVRMEAINYLSRIPGDAGVNALEEILRTEQDERIQRAAVHALMSSDNQRARSSMRALIERKDAPLALRVEAVNGFNSERATSEDAAYLRGLFPRVDNGSLKNAILGAVARIGGTENDQWVISVARNTSESSSVRSNALSRLSRSPTISTADLVKLYDASSESAEMRNRIIAMLGMRKDQEATDKLIDIVRTSTVVDNRTRAIVALRDKKDPRATQALMDILDGKRP
jgi:HEAT repeat protein/TolA-binding protein